MYFGGPLQEEFGWRGYLLPRMLLLYKKYNNYNSYYNNATLISVVLGIIWGTWHLPLWLLEGSPQSKMSFKIVIILVFQIIYKLIKKIR